MMVGSLYGPVIAGQQADFFLGTRPQGLAQNGVPPSRRYARKHAHPYLPAQFRARVLVEGDTIDIGDSETGRIQAIAKGSAWKGLIVLQPGKALFLCRRDQSAIAHQAARRIVITGGDTDDVHGRPPSPPKRESSLVRTCRMVSSQSPGFC